MFASDAVTRGIRVQVRSFFVPERSNVEQQQWFFIYEVGISNEGTEAAQLISRHWIITDADGHVEHVRGAGVVGEQPLLAPGETFRYTSACPLRTPVGTMHGTYEMVTGSGERFNVEIAPFTLGQPDVIH